MPDENEPKQLPDLSAESHEAESTPQHAIEHEKVPAVEEVANTAREEHEETRERLHREERSESSTGNEGQKQMKGDGKFHGPYQDAEFHVVDDAAPKQSASSRAQSHASPSPPPKKGESLWEKLSNAPRRVKEGAEELGARAEAGYHEAREKPVMKKALEKNLKLTELNRQKIEENEEGYRRGKVTKSLYETRKKMYAERQRGYDLAYASESVPFEQKIHAEAQTLFKASQGGATANDKTASAAIIKGLSSTASKVNASGGTFGRPSPAPRFKPGKGTKKTSPTKGTVISPGGRMSVDFGKGLSGLGMGDTRGPAGKPAREESVGSGGYNIFGKGGMFGPKEEPAPKYHHKK